jgi:DNA-binding response OmpR family regulator
VALVLVVDDDSDVVRFITVNLQLEGFDVVTAQDGAQALELVQRTSVDLVLLDVMMPRLDGIETLRRLRADPATALLPVILLTAKSLSADKLVGLAAGANDYIIKPFDTLEVVARVRSTLRWMALMQDNSRGAPGVIELPGLVDADGQPLSADSAAGRTLVASVRSVMSHLIDRLVDEPEAMHRLSPRQFEEVVAGLLERQGFAVELTRGSRDDGIDIFAARSDGLGAFQYLVQCKKYAPDNPVGVEIVREMHGVLAMNRATAGIVATTSRFTRGAREYQNRVPFQLSLRDYNAICRWLSATDSRGS